MHSPVGRSQLYSCVLVFRCYDPEMKNLTVTVPEDVYKRARVRAAEEGVSVSALVTRYLRDLARSDADFAHKVDRQERVLSEIATFRASDRLSRDEVHDRAVR